MRRSDTLDSLFSLFRAPFRVNQATFAIIAGCILLCTAGPLQADADRIPTLRMPEGMSEIPLRGYLAVLAKCGAEDELGAISNAPSAEWSRISSEDFHRGYSDLSYCLRLKLRNDARNPTWYLGLPNNRLDFVEFRMQSPRGIQRHTAGDRLDWSGDEAAAFPVFRFELQPGEEGVLSLRLRSSAIIVFRPFLVSAEEFGARQRLLSLTEIALGIILLILVGAHFFLYGKQNVAIPIYFMLAISFCALFIWVRFGDGALHLYPRSEYLKHNGVFLWVVPAQIFIVLFLYEFLDLRAVSPRIHRLLLFTAVAIAVLYPLHWLDLPSATKNKLLNVSILWIASVSLLGIVAGIRAGRKWILPVFLGWTASLVTVSALTLMHSRLIEYSAFAVYGVVFLLPIFLGCIMIGATQRYAALRQERDEYLQQMMDYLRSESDSRSGPPEGSADAGSPESSESERRVRALDAESLLENLMRLVKQERLYLNDEISLEDFADRLGIRPDQLSALLNLRLGVSFSRLINQHRIEEARKALLENPEHNVLRIAMDCGFGSRSAFNREFKRYTGMTPAAYREQARADRDLADPSQQSIEKQLH